MKIVLRILIDALLVVFAMMGWWWLALVLGFAVAFYFKNFYELIAVGFVIDVVFGIPHTHWLHIGYVFTIICSVYIITVQIIKSTIRRTPW